MESKRREIVVASKKNPEQYTPKARVAPARAARPWGMGLLIDKTQEALRLPGAVPSVILGNALGMAASASMSLDAITHVPRGLDERFRNAVRGLMDASRMPGARMEDLLEREMGKVWVDKRRSEPSRATPQARVNPATPARKAPSVNHASPPKVVIKKGLVFPKAAGKIDKEE